MTKNGVIGTKIIILTVGIIIFAFLAGTQIPVAACVPVKMDREMLGQTVCSQIKTAGRYEGVASTVVPRVHCHNFDVWVNASNGEITREPTYSILDQVQDNMEKQNITRLMIK